MNRNTIIGGVIVVIILAILAAAYFSRPSVKPEDKTGIEIVTTPPPPVAANPCNDILTLKQELLYAQDELLKAQEKVNLIKIDLKAANEKCAELTQVTKEESTPVTKKQTSKKTSSGGGTSSSTVSKTSGQASTAYYEEAPKPAANTGVRTGKISKVLICFNLRDMDPSSFWPALTIESGGNVEGQALNQDGTGWNILTYPVENPIGLYGACTDGRIFVRADLVDPFGPTVIRAGGGTKGTWSNWLTLTRQGEYYVSN